MSFMYESMVSRAPGKRKIKVQEENLLRLMQEDDNDDEEDDDFEVSKEQFNQLIDESDDTVDSDESSSVCSTDSSSSQNSIQQSAPSKPVVIKNRKNHSYSRQQFSPPTIQSTNDQIKSNKKEAIFEILAKAKKQFQISTEWIEKKRICSSEVNVCWICLKKNDLSEMITCKKCGVTVHRDCYGTVGNGRNTSVSDTKWFCSRCISGHLQSCEFCPSMDGCIKETTNGQWCHVICARYILGKDMYKTGLGKALIGVTSLNYKRYGLHECSLCEDKTVSKTGISVKCDAGLCKAFFHVTCAQKYGLLSENETNLNYDTDPYFVYCPVHVEKEKMSASQKLYLTAVAVQKQSIQSGQSHDEAALRKERSSYVSAQNVRFPNPPSTGEPPSRLLSSSPAAMKMLTRKAELMFDVDVRSPALYFPKPSDVRKRHHVAPALTGEFASHYADRELRIVEAKERIGNLMKENNEMMDAQKELERKYEMLQSKLSSSESEQQKFLDEVRSLRRLYVRLKAWTDENKLVATRKTKFSSMKPDLSENQTQTKKRKSLDDSSATKVKAFKTKSNSGAPSSGLLKRCSVCKSGKRPHLLINCDVCHRWLHLACVDPPLVHMPRKSKFSLWQCSECAPASDSGSEENRSSRGSLITSEGRRQTRRSHKPPEKLSSSLLFLPKRIKKRNQATERVRVVIKKKRIESNKSLDSVQTPKQVVSRPRHAVKVTKTIKRHQVDPSTPAIEEKKEVSKPRVVMTRDVNLEKVIENKTHQPNSLKSVKVLPPNLPSFLLPLRPIVPKHLSSLQLKSNDGSVLPRQVNLPSGVQIGFSTSQFAANPGPAYALLPTANVVPQQINVVSPEVFRNILNSGAASWPVENSAIPGTPVSSSSEIADSVPPSTSDDDRTPQKTESVPSAKDDSNDGTKTSEINKETSFSEIQNCEATPTPVCDVCGVSSNEDKMMLCDICKKHYHIWCCSPPLTTRPRKSKFFTWECSACHHSSDESDSLTISAGSETTSDGRRKITRTRKPPEKFANIFYSSQQKKLMRAVLCRRRSGKKVNITPKTSKFSRSSKKLATVLPLPEGSHANNEKIVKDVRDVLEKLTIMVDELVVSNSVVDTFTRATKSGDELTKSNRNDVVITSSSTSHAHLNENLLSNCSTKPAAFNAVRFDCPSISTTVVPFVSNTPLLTSPVTSSNKLEASIVGQSTTQRCEFRFDNMKENAV